MISDILSSSSSMPRRCHDDDDYVTDDVLTATRRPASRRTQASDDVASAAGDVVTGCEATRFAMVATNQNAVGRIAHLRADSESCDDLCDMTKKTGLHPISLF